MVFFGNDVKWRLPGSLSLLNMNLPCSSSTPTPTPETLTSCNGHVGDPEALYLGSGWQPADSGCIFSDVWKNDFFWRAHGCQGENTRETKKQLATILNVFSPRFFVQDNFMFESSLWDEEVAICSRWHLIEAALPSFQVQGPELQSNDSSVQEDYKHYQQLPSNWGIVAFQIGICCLVF